MGLMGLMGLMGMIALAGCAEQSARCKDVLSATGTDGCRDAVMCQIVAQGFHSFLVRSG